MAHFHCEVCCYINKNLPYPWIEVQLLLTSPSMLGLQGYQNSYNVTSFLAGMLRMLSMYHTCNDLEQSRQHIITTVSLIKRNMGQNLGSTGLSDL
jgi:hypothetical protein